MIAAQITGTRSLQHLRHTMFPVSQSHSSHKGHACCNVLIHKVSIVSNKMSNISKGALQSQTRRLISDEIFGSHGKRREWITSEFNNFSTRTINIPMLPMSTVRLRYCTSAKGLLDIFYGDIATSDLSTISLKPQPHRHRSPDSPFVHCDMILSKKNLAKINCIPGDAYRSATKYEYGSVIVEFDVCGLEGNGPAFHTSSSILKLFKLGTRQSTDSLKVSQMLLLNFEDEFDTQGLTLLEPKQGWTLAYDADGHWTCPEFVFSSRVKLNLVKGNVKIGFMDHVCPFEGQFCSECKLSQEAISYILNNKIFGGKDYSNCQPSAIRTSTCVGEERAVKKGDITHWDSPSELAIQLFSMSIPFGKRREFRKHYASVFEDFETIVDYFDKNQERTFSYLESEY